MDLVQDDELQPHEIDALKALPRAVDTGSLLEERTVRTLQARGLVQSGRPRVALAWWGWAAAAVAAGIIFIAGFSVGRSSDAQRSRAITAATSNRLSGEPGHATGARTVPAANAREVALTSADADSTHNSARYVVWF
jgi:hypothetical protein